MKKKILGTNLETYMMNRSKSSKQNDDPYSQTQRAIIFKMIASTTGSRDSVLSQ